MADKIAVVSVIHQNSLPFVSDFLRSVEDQTMKGFDLVLFFDGVSINEASTDFTRVVRKRVNRLSIAKIREEAIEYVRKQYEINIFVDSDDILLPCRVAEAEKALQNCDGASNGLHLVDKEGKALGASFCTTSETEPFQKIEDANSFGLSNTAYRSSALNSVPRIPDEIVPVDWFLSLSLWLQGKILINDPLITMKYRVHSSNVSNVVGPVSRTDLVNGIAVVKKLLEAVLKSIPENEAKPDHWKRLKNRLTDVKLFDDAMKDKTREGRYLKEVNNLASTSKQWWWYVAHPRLKSLWKIK